MALITYIDGIPTFSTQVEALAWGRQHGNISGFHTHIVNNEITYMAGADHNAITSNYTVQQNAPLTSAQSITVEPSTIPEIVHTTPQPTPITTPMTTPMTTTTTPMTTPTTGGGGGGY
jgi:hypothetical protein